MLIACSHPYQVWVRDDFHPKQTQRAYQRHHQAYSNHQARAAADAHTVAPVTQCSPENEVTVKASIHEAVLGSQAEIDVNLTFNIIHKPY